MALATLKKCCCVIDLRLGCFIIAYASLVFEVISLVLNSFIAEAVKYEAIHHPVRYIYALQYVVFLAMVITFVKSFLSIALLVGLKQRRPDHLFMWYLAYIASVIMEASVVGVFFTHEFEYFGTELNWAIRSERVIVLLITAYFILVVRSYYHKMNEEPNYYQIVAYRRNKEPKPASDKQVDDDSMEKRLSVVSIITSERNVKPPVPHKPSKLFIGGGEVYSVPSSIYAVLSFTMVIIMIVAATSVGAEKTGFTAIENVEDIELKAGLQGLYAMCIILCLMFTLKFLFDVFFVYGVVTERAGIIKSYVIMWIVFFLLHMFIFFLNVANFGAGTICTELFNIGLNVYMILLIRSYYKMLNSREEV